MHNREYYVSIFVTHTTHFSLSSTIAISELLGVTDESKSLWEYPSNTLLAEVLQAMSEGVHRCLVEYDSAPVGKTTMTDIRLLSQRDVMAYLVETHQQFVAGNQSMSLGSDKNQVWSQTVEESGLFSPTDKEKLVLVDLKMTGLAAMRRLGQFQTTAAGVVDEDGRLVATLSSSDVGVVYIYMCVCERERERERPRFEHATHPLPNLSIPIRSADSQVKHFTRSSRPWERFSLSCTSRKSC